MKRFTQNEQGSALLGLLLAICILAGIVMLSGVSFYGGPGSQSAAPVERATQHAPVVSGAMAEAAAELAAITEPGKDVFTLGELVDAGYLDADLTTEQQTATVTRTEAGTFVFQP